MCKIVNEKKGEISSDAERELHNTHTIYFVVVVDVDEIIIRINLRTV